MSEIPTLIRPEDPKLHLFAIVVDWFQKHSLAKKMFSPVYSFLFAIAPEVPSSFSVIVRRPPTRRAFLWGYFLGFIFCFVVIFVWSVINGTWHGSDPHRLYFSSDRENLINYLILCPAYVGFCSQLIVLTILGWNEITSSSDDLQPGLPKGSLGLLFLTVISVSAAFSVNYIAECLNPAIYPRIGWWVGFVTVDGVRVLSRLGIYYALLNFVLLVVCITALMAFVSMFFLCLRFGDRLSHLPPNSEATIESIRKSLAAFTEAYIVLKLLVVALMLNAYLWKYFSHPSHSLNLVVLGLVLTVVGVFLVSLPRYYIELQWFKFRVNQANALKQPPSTESEDIRRFRARLVAMIADGLIIGGFAFSFFL